MIKIPFSNLEKYKEEYLDNFRKRVSNKLPDFPSPYELKSSEDKNNFVRDLLINPFESDFLFLKEYYLTVKFIIDINYICADITDNTKPSILNKETQRLFSNYIKELNSDSIFCEVITNKSPEQTYYDLIKTKAFLEQFISNRKDGSRSSCKSFQKLEEELRCRMAKNYAIYKCVRDFFIIIQRQYNSSKFKDNRITLIEALGVYVCPYCNRQYIDIFKRKNKSKIAIAELDHFYPKSKFPLYAISLFNLIPSCAKCNSLKSNDSIAYLYPYSKHADTENKQRYFQLYFEDYDQLRGVSAEHKPRIGLTSKDSKILANANALFHEELYKNHEDFAQRLLRVQRLDNPEYRKSINSYFKDYKLTESDLHEVFYGFNGSSEELFEKPLAKLAHDIIFFTKK